MPDNIDPRLTALTLRHGNGSFVYIEIKSYSEAVSTLPEIETLAGRERIVVLYFQLDSANSVDEAVHISEYFKANLSKEDSQYVSLYYSYGVAHSVFVNHFDRNIKQSLQDIEDKHYAWFPPAGIDRGLIYKP